MTIYKLGCIWGKGAPDFYEMIKSKNISLSHISDCNPKKNSVILITNGHTVKAITILLEDCQPVTNNPELKDSFDEYRISYNNETLYAKSKWIELKPEDYFLFKTQDGICQIHKQEIHQITKSLMSKYMLNENLNQQIELLKYKKQIILQGPPGTGKTKTAKDIAVEMLGLGNVQDLNNNEQVKLIQFHPSYTYEDFVRGIVSVPNEDSEGVLFKTENKILAEFAEIAQLNYKQYLNTRNSLTLEEWTINIANDYLSHVNDEIENKKTKYYLNNSTAYISKINENSFTYNNEDWSGSGFELTFEEFYKCCMDNREMVRMKSPETSLSKLDHIGKMGIHLLDDFWEFQDKQSSFIEITQKKLKNYVLIIDEINRANLPSVLGELIYALEYRDEAVESMYEFEGKREIILPSNLYIIGTMNTADRSVGHIDYAIKRRFAFVDVLPTDQAIDDVVTDPDLNAKAKGLYHKVAELFNEDTDKTVYLQSDFKAKDVQLGHSYFLVETEKQLELKLEFEIKPLLNEYVKDGILSEDALLEIGKL
ncbi:McrB family protein [Flavobacterium sp. XS1P27]|uniref:McrB family protein n=1 Tax=Flavobacterium sp. XS1P27 TaxID=3401724 RepID=UPI003AB01423